MYDLEQSTVKRDMGWFKQPPTENFVNQLDFVPFNSGNTAPGQNETVFFSRVQSEASKICNWRERWKEPGNYIRKFRLAHLSLSWKNNPMIEAKLPIFFEVFERINTPRNFLWFCGVFQMRSLSFFVFVLKLQENTSSNLTGTCNPAWSLRCLVRGFSVGWFTSPVYSPSYGRLHSLNLREDHTINK